MGMKTREEDFVSQLIVDSTHAFLLCFTNTGRVYWLKVYEIPDVGAAGKGKSMQACSISSPAKKSAPFCPSAILKKRANSSSSPRKKAPSRKRRSRTSPTSWPVASSPSASILTMS